jgi:hypothetical protein
LTVLKDTRSAEKSSSFLRVGLTLVWESFSRADCMDLTAVWYPLTCSRAFWTGPDLRMSESTSAWVGSKTSGDPAPKPPYLAAKAGSGASVVTVANKRPAVRLAAACVRNA